MSTIQLPLTSHACAWTRQHHGRVDCGCPAIKGKCEPARAEVPDLTKCPSFERAWRRGERPAPPPPRATAGVAKELPCVHLGAPTGHTVACGSCRGRVELKAHACAVHGTCTLGEGGQIAGCKGCPDSTPGIAYGRPVVRNLLYHVAPFSGNGVWQRNVEQLRRRMRLFNGRRVVAIVTGQGLDQPDAVKAAFGGDVHDWIVLPNDLKLREVMTLVPLLDKVASAQPHEVTFYAHAKGVTRPVNSGTTVPRWMEVMYESCLDYWPLVERQLLYSPVTGSFKKSGWCFTGSKSAWHYSGTFYWLRSCMTFDRAAWRTVDQQWWGTESWPGLVFGASEAACLFHGKSPANFDLYDKRYFDGVVEPAYAAWRVERADDRRAP